MRTRPVTLSTYSLRTRSATREHLCSVRIEHDLQQSLAVSQVDEDDAAVISAPVGPAGHRHDLADQRLADLTAIVSAHKLRTAKREARDAKA